MEYQEILQNARTCMGPYCKACPVCNGQACKNTIPGPGAKGSGTGFARNYQKWQELRVNLDTIGENRRADTSFDFFGHRLALPVMAAPVGAMQLHYGDKYDDLTYNRLLLAACAKAGLQCILVHNGDEPRHMEGNVLLNHLLGAQSHYLGPVTAEERSAYVEKLARELSGGHRPYIVRNGATSGRGCLGYVKAVPELVRQTREMGLENLTLKLWVPTSSQAWNPSPLKTAELLQADLAQVGVTVDIVPVEGRFQEARLMDMNHDLTLAGWATDSNDPDSFFRPLLSCAAIRSQTNYAHWCDRDFDGVLQSALSSQQLAYRIEAYTRAQTILAEQLPVLPLASSLRLQAYRYDMKGLVLSPFGNASFAGVSREPTEDKQP